MNIYKAHMSPTLNGSSVIRHFEGSDEIEIHDGITCDFYTGLLHMYFYHIEQQTCMMYAPKAPKYAHTKLCQGNIMMVYPQLCLRYVNHQAKYISAYTRYTYTYICVAFNYKYASHYQVRKFTQVCNWEHN